MRVVPGHRHLLVGAVAREPPEPVAPLPILREVRPEAADHHGLLARDVLAAERRERQPRAVHARDGLRRDGTRARVRRERARAVRRPPRAPSHLLDVHRRVVAGIPRLGGGRLSRVRDRVEASELRRDGGVVGEHVTTHRCVSRLPGAARDARALASRSAFNECTFQSDRRHWPDRMNSSRDAPSTPSAEDERQRASPLTSRASACDPGAEARRPIGPAPRAASGLRVDDGR